MPTWLTMRSRTTPPTTGTRPASGGPTSSAWPAPWPTVSRQGPSVSHFAASVLADAAAWAWTAPRSPAHLGLDESTVAAAEDGVLPPTEAPPALVRLALFDDDVL